MSLQASNAVWNHSRSKGAARLVLLCLADHANEDWRCWPSVETIARKTAVSERQVTRSLGQLVADGEIEKVQNGGGRGNATVYKILIKGDRVSPLEGEEKGDISSLKGDTLSKRVTSDPIKGDTLSPDPLKNHHRTVKEQEVKNARTRGEESDPFPFRENPVVSAVESEADERVKAILEVCGLRADVPQHVAQAENAAVQVSHASPDEIRRRYGVNVGPDGGYNWYFDDWRGCKGQMPRPVDLVNTIGYQKNKKARIGVNGNHPKRPVTAAESFAEVFE